MTVWRIGLLGKLQSYRISNRFINLLYSMYSKTKLSVQLQNGLTKALQSKQETLLNKSQIK